MYLTKTIYGKCSLKLLRITVPWLSTEDSQRELCVAFALQKLRRVRQVDLEEFVLFRGMNSIHVHELLAMFSTATKSSDV